MNRRGGLRKSKSLDGRENYTSISIDDEEEEYSNHSSATSFMKQIEEMPDIPFECCIYKVPPPLRVLNEKVYTPKVVSIGPFHHNQKELKGMEEHKLRCMKKFLVRTNISLDDFIMAIKGFEMRARNCYAEKIDLSVDEFVKMLILDSFFIFEVRYAWISGYENFYLPMQPEFYITDIILLENQIPFFVFNDLYLFAFPAYIRNEFHKLSIAYISDLVLLKNMKNKNLSSKVEYLNLGNEIKHLVDLLKICHLPLALRSPSSEKRYENMNLSIPNALQLQEAGIQLLKLDIGGDFLLDINYNEGVLKIPPLVVQDWSEIVLSNILVLEKFHYLNVSCVKDFVFFMQMLVGTDKDADLLIQNDIIEDWIGRSSTVAALLNKLGQDILIYILSYYFYDTSKGLNTYCSVTRNKWKATFKRDYCSAPWIIASMATAVILLILTLLSAIANFLAL